MVLILEFDEGETRIENVGGSEGGAESRKEDNPLCEVFR